MIISTNICDGNIFAVYQVRGDPLIKYYFITHAVYATNLLSYFFVVVGMRDGRVRRISYMHADMQSTQQAHDDETTLIQQWLH